MTILDDGLIDTYEAELEADEARIRLCPPVILSARLP